MVVREVALQNRWFGNSEQMGIGDKVYELHLAMSGTLRRVNTWLKDRPILPLTIACILITLFFRYQIITTSAGLGLRLDRFTGQVVIIEGDRLYPAREFDGNTIVGGRS
jgi:hypothetical protein